MLFRASLGLFVTALLTVGSPSTVLAADGNDAARANAFDDDWEPAWVEHCRDVFMAGADKTEGFVLQVGDSITHANPYSQWPRGGAGKTIEDQAFFDWSPADQWGDGDADATSTNGWYLAAADTSNQRGMTASSGIDTAEYLSGDGNGGGAMPAESDPAMARDIVDNGGLYSGNLHIETVAAAFEGAQIAVLMLGTNDINGGRPAAEFGANLAAIVEVLEQRNIVVVLSTIPPVYDDDGGTEVAAYNAEIQDLAQTVGLPVIDLHGEILARQPDGAWNGTLLNMDDVHPSASVGQFNSSANPYDPGGVAAEHCTGDAPLTVGYLLRSWLTVQKLKEVRAYVVDGEDPPDGPGPGTGSSGDDGTDDTGDDSGAGTTTGGIGVTGDEDPSGLDGDDSDGDGDGPGDAGPAEDSSVGGDSTGGSSAADDGDSGCGCRNGDGAGPGIFALTMLAFAFGRRRDR